MTSKECGEMSEGSLVIHRSRLDWGQGKVLHIRGEDALVYFKGQVASTPEGKVVRMQIPADRLQVIPQRADVELDHLPPYDPDSMKFKRPATKVDLVRSRMLFQTRYPLGFGDPLYHSLTDERAYKVAAHERFVDSLPQLQVLATNGTGEQIRSLLERVYRGDRGGDIEGLNLMHPRYEAPHYFAALTDDSEAQNYLSAVLSFISKVSEATFHEYTSTVSRMQWNVERGDKGLWPLFSWLPFIGNPGLHMMVRPSVAREFASAMGFDLHLQSDLDYQSYVGVLKMSQLLMSKLQESELNLSRRALDMIDVQSFMWVAIKYFEPNALEGKES
jgi:hypothetical protein